MIAVLRRFLSTRPSTLDSWRRDPRCERAGSIESWHRIHSALRAPRFLPLIRPKEGTYERTR